MNPKIHCLIEDLEHPHESTRLEAIAALQEMGDEAVPPLVALLSVSRSPVVRRLAAHALGHLQHPEAVGPLCETLYDHSSRVQEMAYASLAKTLPHCFLGFCRGLDGTEGLERQRAILRFERLGTAFNPQVPPEGRLAGEERLRGMIARHLSRHESSPVPILCSVVEASVHWWPRAVAAEALGLLGDHRATIPLTRLLEATGWWHADAYEASRMLCGVVAQALGRIALRDPTVELRAALPVLRKYLPPWYYSWPENARTISTAIRLIETQTRTLRHLPVPAFAPLPGVESLPVPAGAPQLDGATLPRPSVARETDQVAPPRLRRSPRDWLFRHLLRR